MSQNRMNQPWIPLAQLPHPFWPRNSQALQANQPALVSALAPHRRRSDIWLRLCPEGGYACKYTARAVEYGVHEFSSPAEEIARFAAPLESAFAQGAWLVVTLGSGMGLFLPSVVAYLERHHRGEPKGLLVLEQDLGLLCAGLCLYDLSAVLQIGRVLFAVGPNLAQAVNRLCDEHHLETLDAAQIRAVVGYNIADPERRLDQQHALEAFRKHHAESRERYFGLLRGAEHYWSAPRRPIQKVWTHITDDRAAGGILLGLTQGFAELGLQSRALHFRDRLFSRFHRCAFDFFSYLPDLMLCVNHSSRYVAAFAGDAPIPRLVWYVDHPANTVEVAYHPYDYCIGLSDQFFPEIERRGGKAIGCVPAASSGSFEKPALNPKWKHDVAYVGSVMDLSPVFTGMETECRQWVEPVIGAQLADPMRPLSLIVEDHPSPPDLRKRLAERLARHLPKARYMNESRLVDYFLYAEANSRRRVQFMSALRRYSRLGIYGPNDWERLLPDDSFRRCYLGPIPNAEELGALYRICKINLSINSLQGFGFVNPRIFDVPTAGGFLVAEWVPGLETFFAPEKELFWFTTPEEMITVIDHALTDESLRLATLSRAQERISRDHTYRSRAQTILELLESLLVWCPPLPA